MYCKLNERGYVIFPPTVAKTEHGYIFNCDKDINWLRENGYEDHDQAWIDEHTEPAPVVIAEYSILKIYDLIGDELWEQLMSQLTPVQRKRISFAQVFAEDDPDFSAAVTELRKYYPNVDEILEKARIN